MAKTETITTNAAILAAYARIQARAKAEGDILHSLPDELPTRCPGSFQVGTCQGHPTGPWIEDGFLRVPSTFHPPGGVPVPGALYREPVEQGTETSKIEALARECALAAYAADGGAGLIEVSDPLPGDYTALREELGREPAREETREFERVYRETLEGLID